MTWSVIHMMENGYFCKKYSTAKVSIRLFDSDTRFWCRKFLFPGSDTVYCTVSLSKWSEINEIDIYEKYLEEWT